MMDSPRALDDTELQTLAQTWRREALTGSWQAGRMARALEAEQRRRVVESAWQQLDPAPLPTEHGGWWRLQR